MKTLSTIFANIESGHAGMNEAVFCIGCVILVAVICHYLPSGKVQTSKK